MIVTDTHQGEGGCVHVNVTDTHRHWSKQGCAWNLLTVVGVAGRVRAGGMGDGEKLSYSCGYIDCCGLVTSFSGEAHADARGTDTDRVAARGA